MERPYASQVHQLDQVWLQQSVLIAVVHLNLGYVVNGAGIGNMVTLQLAPVA